MIEKFRGPAASRRWRPHCNHPVGDRQSSIRRTRRRRATLGDLLPPNAPGGNSGRLGAPGARRRAGDQRRCRRSTSGPIGSCSRWSPDLRQPREAEEVTLDVFRRMADGRATTRPPDRSWDQMMIRRSRRPTACASNTGSASIHQRRRRSERPRTPSRAVQHRSLHNADDSHPTTRPSDRVFSGSPIRAAARLAQPVGT